MKKMQFYGQHEFPEIGISKAETCGTSCLMMALDYFGKEFPKKSKEPVYYRKYKIRYNHMKGTLGSAIAFALSEKGLDVKIVHSSVNYLDNEDDYYDKECYAALLAEHKKYIAEGGFKSETGVDIDCETIKKELENGRIVITQTFIEGNADGIHEKVMHWILIYGFDKGIFSVCDPGCGKIKLSEREAENYIKTPFGKTYISVGEK